MSEDEAIAASVAANGWHAIVVNDYKPEFAYTCGLLTTFNHPEVIIFGLGAQTSYSILEVLVEEIRGERSFALPGVYDGVLAKLPVGIRPVDPTRHEMYLGYAMGHCRHTGTVGGLIAVQVYWSDKQGRFPFEEGCDPHVAALQPLLDAPVSGFE